MKRLAKGLSSWTWDVTAWDLVLKMASFGLTELSYENS
jgi:hypothetical protein